MVQEFSLFQKNQDHLEEIMELLQMLDKSSLQGYCHCKDSTGKIHSLVSDQSPDEETSRLLLQEFNRPVSSSEQICSDDGTLFAMTLRTLKATLFFHNPDHTTIGEVPLEHLSLLVGQFFLSKEHKK